ncbi:hypothetical protein [Streptomyces sp. 142MFCol3.1]|uniref:hypothetical protein n=1 Tax=Streptomyces sp. 142MFCol3.1 TaxID=1172179 RepID=UPI001319C956|nr:hypothetical protein [Streptomyces sp. 142MFCol3.1]
MAATVNGHVQHRRDGQRAQQANDESAQRRAEHDVLGVVLKEWRRLQRLLHQVPGRTYLARPPEDPEDRGTIDRLRTAAQRYVERAPYGDGRPTDDIERLLDMLQDWNAYCGEAGAVAADDLFGNMQQLDNFITTELAVDTSETDLTPYARRLSPRAAFRRGLRG